MKFTKMTKIILLRIILCLCLTAHLGAQDADFDSGDDLTKDMRELKSEFTTFFNNRMNNDGGTFINQMIKALENGVISDGQKIEQINGVFSGKAIYPEITNGTQVVKNIGMVPLNGHYWERKQKLPGVPGPGWFLYFKINEKSEVYHLSLRYMTVKDVYMNWFGK